MKKLLVITILVFCVRLLAVSQEMPPAFITDSIDGYINKALKVWNIPGVAVAIVKDGEVVLVKGYGLQSIDRNEKVDENTLFMIGSNTKAFTGTLIAWLDYDKKCSLDDKVVKWLPNFTMKDPWVTKELNLTDILCHRVGMETFQGDFMYWTSALTKPQVIEKFGKLSPKYDFRTKWGYTNAGFLIAGECIQQISGESWEQMIKTRFFDPLQMTRSQALSVNLPAQQNIAAPHTLVFDSLKLLPYPIIDNLAPAGSISSSASEMCHWLICQLDSGRYQNKQVIPFPVIQQTRQPKSIVGSSYSAFNRTNYNLYGLGWELTDYEGREIVSHTGGVNGFVTSVTLIPEENLGVVVLTNTDQNGFYEALKLEILDAYLDLPYRNYSDLYFSYGSNKRNRQKNLYNMQRDTIAMHNTPEISFEQFNGQYNNTVYGNIIIESNANNLIMTFEHHPNLTGKLEYLNNNRFLCTYSDPTYGIKAIPFNVVSGQVKSFQLRVADFLEFTEYTFVKD